MDYSSSDHRFTVSDAWTVVVSNELVLYRETRQRSFSRGRGGPSMDDDQPAREGQCCSPGSRAPFISPQA